MNTVSLLILYAAMVGLTMCLIMEIKNHVMRRMSGVVRLAAFVVVGVSVLSCSKDDDGGGGDTPTDAPNWKYEQNSENYRTMTMIATLPEEMLSSCNAQDQMAVFAGNELLGENHPLKEDNTRYYIIIGAPRGEHSDMRVKYYSAARHKIYTTQVIGRFEADMMLGSGTEPFVVEVER